MTSVAVLTDSVACLSPEQRAELGVGMVGIYLTIDGTTYRDSVDLSSREFFARLADIGSYTSSAPSVGDWAAEMERVIDAGADAILVVCLSAKLSGTFSAARAAAALMSVPVAVVDSRSAAAAEGLYVRRLAEQARAGVSLDELVARAEERRGHYHLECVLSGLDRLSRSGRMPATMAKLGDAVGIKPMVALDDEGTVRAAGVVRGLSRGIDRIHRRIVETFPPGVAGRVVVTHALLEEEADMLVQRLRTARPALDVGVALFSPVMGAHTGPIVGAGWEAPTITTEVG